LLKVVFLPNYSVSQAEIIIPASDISQHISTAGTEASGTSNMKFCLNGGLILGTLDGANIEIREEIGEENMFILGCLTPEVPELRAKMREGLLPLDPRLETVFELIKSGWLSKGNEDEQELFDTIVDSITGGNDHYLVCYDFPSYLDAQARIDACWNNKKEWVKKSILSTIGMGKFSSDRTIKEYAEQIWQVEPTPFVPVLPENGVVEIQDDDDDDE